MEENPKIIPFIPFKQKPVDIPVMDVFLPPHFMHVAELLGIDDLFTGEPSPEHRIHDVSDPELALALRLGLIANGESLEDIDDIFMNEMILNSEFPRLMTVGDFLSRFDDEENLLITMSLEKAVHEALLIQKKIKRLTLDIETAKINSKGRILKRTTRHAYTAVLVVAVEAEIVLAFDVFEKDVHSEIVMCRLLLTALSIVPEETGLCLRSGSVCYHPEVASLCEEMEMSFTISADLTDSFLQLVQSTADTEWHPCRRGEEAMELYYQPEGWDREYRHIVVRKMTGKDIFGPVYSYDAFVTNISRKQVSKTVKLHDRRPSTEKIIKKLLEKYFSGRG